ncbi:MAG TPA: 2Fe-2S iron-sulfur cluster-binding protein [Candidatus Dormibacteraeota bacterium]|nr:2Fe-2S iron-sulfur cluster-binding protein [Candidatus Dormibacteraeota bacterium]
MMTESAPKEHQIRLIFPDAMEKTISVHEDELVLLAAFRKGIDLPSMCLQGWCLTCAGRVEGQGAWDQSAARRYFEEDRESGFILLCTAKARSDLVVRTHQREAMRDERDRQGLPAPRG